MAFHTVAYGSSIDNTEDVDVPAINELSMTISNGHFYPSRDLWVVGAYANSPTLTRARINTNTLKLQSAPYIRPFDAATGALPKDNPNFMFLGNRPLRVKALEEIQVQATAAPAVTEACIFLLWLADQIEHLDIVDDYWIRFTSSTDLVSANNNKWTQIAVTFDQSLGSGTYAVIGMEFSSTTAQAARLQFDDQAFRPGVLAQNAKSRRTHASFYEAAYGVWGRFRNVTPPRVEVLATGNDAADTMEGYLRVVRVSAT